MELQKLQPLASQKMSSYSSSSSYGDGSSDDDYDGDDDDSSESDSYGSSSSTSSSPIGLENYEMARRQMCPGSIIPRNPQQDPLNRTLNLTIL